MDFSQFIYHRPNMNWLKSNPTDLRVNISFQHCSSSHTQPPVPRWPSRAPHAVPGVFHHLHSVLTILSSLHRSSREIFDPRGKFTAFLGCQILFGRNRSTLFWFFKFIHYPPSEAKPSETPWPWPWRASPALVAASCHCVRCQIDGEHWGPPSRYLGKGLSTHLRFAAGFSGVFSIR